MKRGFTLVEMVFVLVIMSIVAQLANIAINARREAAIVDSLTEYIQVFTGAIRMYYYNHNGNFPTDFTHGIELKTVESLKPYLPRNFSHFKILENCIVTAYIKEDDENPATTEDLKTLVGYGIVVTTTKSENALTKLKEQLLLELNMKDSETAEKRQDLMDLIQIDPSTGTLIFYLKTTHKSYL